jgi:hypothetical protein
MKWSVSRDRRLQKRMREGRRCRDKRGSCCPTNGVVRKNVLDRDAVLLAGLGNSSLSQLQLMLDTARHFDMTSEGMFRRRAVGRHDDATCLNQWCNLRGSNTRDDQRK